MLLEEDHRSIDVVVLELVQVLKTVYELCRGRQCICDDNFAERVRRGCFTRGRRGRINVMRGRING